MAPLNLSLNHPRSSLTLLFSITFNTWQYLPADGQLFIVILLTYGMYFTAWTREH